MTDTCNYPLLVHRRVNLVECSDPSCTLPTEAHAKWLPCRWVWPYAHGRVSGGKPFPTTKCNDCFHIRRAGYAKIEPPALPLLQVQP